MAREDPDLDLATASVFIDFDGTISRSDTGVHLLDRLAPSSWREIESLYDAGEIGSRECMVREWAMVTADRAEIERVAREVPIDDGFVPLVQFLRRAGAEVTVLSDGFGFRAQEVAAFVDVPVITNRIDWENGQLVFPYTDPSCDCGTCGACKRVPIREAKRRGCTSVLIGDGTSDVKAATDADLVFAKDELASWCAANDRPFHRFECLNDVLHWLAKSTGPG